MCWSQGLMEKPSSILYFDYLLVWSGRVGAIFFFWHLGLQ